MGVKGEPADVQVVFDSLKEDFGASDMVEFAVYDIPPEWKTRVGLLQLTVPELQDLKTRLQGGLRLTAASNPPSVTAVCIGSTDG